MIGFNCFAGGGCLGSLSWGKTHPSINSNSMTRAMSDAGAPAAPNPGSTRYAGIAKSSTRNAVNSMGRRRMAAT